MFYELNAIIFIFLATKTIPVQSGSYFSQLYDRVSSTVLDSVMQPEVFEIYEPGDNQYNYLFEYKYSSPHLLSKCIKFHDSEIVRLDLSRFTGRWDRHMGSVPLPSNYDYGLVEHDATNNFSHFQYVPWGYHSHKYERNDTNMLRSLFIISDFFGIKIIDDEVIVGVDYDLYFLKYSCLVVGDRVSASLHFQLRPEATAQLDTNPELFAQILDSIPDKTVNKIRHLLPNLIHEKDDRFKDVGKQYAQRLTKRLEKYRNDNLLSDKSDDQMFQYLHKNCLKFSEEELKLSQFSNIDSSIDWTLIFGDKNGEKIPFNRITIQRLTENAFNVSLLIGNTFIANSDQYYDPKSRGFWSYTEGMRSFEVILYLDEEHRFTYSCEERETNGKLQTKEKLRFFVNENKAKTESFGSDYIETIINKLKPNLKVENLNKINHLEKQLQLVHVVPIGKEQVKKEPAKKEDTHQEL